MNYKTRQPFPHAAYVEGQRNFTYFDRSLTSGLTDVVIESPGDFLYIDQASTGAVSVELNMRQGGTLAPILLAAGGSIECDFASIKLTASAQLNRSVRVIVGNGARIKGGANVNPSSMSVSVVDGGLIRTIENKAFIGYSIAAAVAGNYAHNQLFNPATSSKNLYVEKIASSSVTAQEVIVGKNSAAYTSSTTTPMNKQIGSSVASAAQLRSTNAVAASLSGVGPVFRIQANQTKEWIFDEPVLILPGYGLCAVAGTVNTDITTSFEWYEA